MTEESIEEPPLRHEADAHRLGLDFRLDGGPIFNRGPLDGSARLLIIRQDPAQHETIVAKLGFTRGYGFINMYLYSAGGVSFEAGDFIERGRPSLPLRPKRCSRI